MYAWIDGSTTKPTYSFLCIYKKVELSILENFDGYRWVFRGFLIKDFLVLLPISSRCAYLSFLDFYFYFIEKILV